MQDSNIYEAPTQKDAREARILSLEERAELAQPSLKVNDVALAASLLARVPKITLDVISNVLQFAGLLVVFDAETRENRRGRYDMNEEYLRLNIPEESTLALPRGMALSKCYEVVVQCTSRDQGWASQDHEHDGTYAASFTWSEVAVLKNTTDGGTEVARTLVCRNARVVNTSRHHVRHFRSPDDIPDHVAPGSSLQLIIRSQYPGWANTVEYGHLRARFFVELDEDFEFLSPTEIAKAIPSEPAQGRCTVQ
ncbi:hypothetical protein Poli38472_006063 [Pythium oligandrum]|uniref:Uncharacterized protein n=1 Tax=Pythium oligandrum TaxID=41045 RepID=A0A8K1FLT4_PYTOL|nr:hypothetical protein Poli38472_006063 [Pythium oligandrum]|eukprot:TMW68595.1 hypothetical protein Poli38472_006063 [Pythium oligandrum]